MTRGGNAFPFTRYPSMYSPWVLSTTSNAAAEPMVTRISSGTDSAVHGRTVGVLVEGRCDAMCDSSLDHVVGRSMLNGPSSDVLACARPRDAPTSPLPGASTSPLPGGAPTSAGAQVVVAGADAAHVRRGRVGVARCGGRMEHQAGRNSFALRRATEGNT